MLSRGRTRILMLGTLVAVLALVLQACGPAEQPTAVPTKAPPAPTATAAAVPAGPTAAPTVAVPTAAPTAVRFVTPTPTEKEPKYGGIAVIAGRADPTAGWDYMRDTNYDIHQAGQPIFGTGNLVRTCPDDPYARCPGLAESWDVNSEFTVWTFKIRDGVLWHDGRPFTADDAKWWIDLSVKGVEGRRPSNTVTSFGDFKSAEVVDGNKVRITLKTEAPQYLLELGHPTNVLAHPRHLMEPEIKKGNANVAPLDVKLVGTGPFKLLQYNKGSNVSVRRFDKYWEKDAKGRQLPFMDGIDFPLNLVRETQVASFRVGRLDGTGRGNLIFWLPQQVDTAKKQFGDGAAFWPLITGGRNFGFNMTRPSVFSDVKVRRALSLAFDRDEFARITYPDLAKALPIFFSGSPWVNPDYMTWPGYNPATREKDRAEAKRLLAEAGFPNGFKTELQCLNNWLQDCEWAAGELRKHLNVEAAIKVIDQATWNERRCKGDYDFIAQGASVNAAFPETVKQNVVSAQTGACANFYHNDLAVDAFFGRLAKARTVQERAKIAQELERYIIQEKVYNISLATNVSPFATRSYLKNIRMGITDARDYMTQADVWLDK